MAKFVVCVLLFWNVQRAHSARDVDRQTPVAGSHHHHHTHNPNHRHNSTWDEVGAPSSFGMRPCTPLIKDNCQEGRFVPCGTLRGYPIVGATKSTRCKPGSGALSFGEGMVVQFTAGDPKDGGKCMEILMQVGECWGKAPNGGTYSCQGRCGVSCSARGGCANWARDCLKHDVCSYYYSSRGGGADKNCGWAFWRAADDFLSRCHSRKCGWRISNRDSDVCPLLKPTEFVSKMDPDEAEDVFTV